MTFSKNEKTAVAIVGAIVVIVLGSVAYFSGTSSTPAITTTSTSGPSSGTAN